jgi:hypothetical protein
MKLTTSEKGIFKYNYSNNSTIIYRLFIRLYFKLKQLGFNA